VRRPWLVALALLGYRTLEESGPERDGYRTLEESGPERDGYRTLDESGPERARQPSAPSEAPAAASAFASPPPTVTSPTERANALVRDGAAEGDWCTGGLSALDADVCYVLPPLPPGKPRRLLVYLHGIVPPQPESPQKRTVQAAVLEACLRAGVAALLPRGRRGVGPPHAVGWWAWPTTPTSIAALAPSIVAHLAQAKEKLEARAGAPFERTYVAGSSNGAYFLAALAVRGDLPAAAFPVDGFGAMSGGGAGPGAAQRLAAASPRPFYVGFGSYDEETKAGAGSLAAALRTAHWPLRVAEHPLPHGASSVYLDEAFAFWDAAERHDASP
jgi:predicted esterase